MSFDPGYGETPLPFEELDALLPKVRASLDDPITKATVYDLEQAVEAEVAEDRLEIEVLLSDRFLRDLLRRL